MERLLELVQQQDILPNTAECDIYMVYQNDAGQQQAMVLAEQLRDAGLRVVVHAGPKSMRAQFRRADNSGALAAIILGQSELETQQARDRKSTRLNSSHVAISYAVFCLKKKK